MLSEGIIEDIKSLAGSGLGVKDIAAALGVEESAVDNVLSSRPAGEGEATSSSLIKFRSDEDIISDSDHEECIETALNIAKYSDNDAARLKAIQWLHNEKIGRNREVHQAMLARSSRGGANLNTGGNNIFVQIQEAKDRASAIKQKVAEGNVVEVEEVKAEDV